MTEKKNKIYKRYTYPDGRILELTKEEFDRVVDVMRELINAKRKREGKPALLSLPKKQFESLSR